MSSPWREASHCVAAPSAWASSPSRCHPRRLPHGAMKAFLLLGAAAVLHAATLPPAPSGPAAVSFGDGTLTAANFTRAIQSQGEPAACTTARPPVPSDAKSPRCRHRGLHCTVVPRLSQTRKGHKQCCSPSRLTRPAAGIRQCDGEPERAAQGGGGEE